MIIFKRVEKEIINLELEAKQNKKNDFPNDIVKEKMKAMKLISSYLHSLDWLKHEKTKERVKVFIQFKYSYKDAANFLKEDSLTAFETSMWYCAKKFSEAIGETTISRIIEGEIVEGLRQFYISTGKLQLNTIVAPDIADLFEKASRVDGLIHASECKNELRFIKGLTMKNLETKVKLLNRNKVAFIRYILEKPDQRYNKQRELIYDYLEGNLSDIDEVVLSLKDVEVHI